MSDYKTATITAQNEFTDAHEFNGEFNVSVSGTFVATVTIQRSYNGGTTWNDVQDWIEPVEGLARDAKDATGILYRAGVKTGDYTSGTINVRLG